MMLTNPYNDAMALQQAQRSGAYNAGQSLGAAIEKMGTEYSNKKKGNELADMIDKIQQEAKANNTAPDYSSVTRHLLTTLNPEERKQAMMNIASTGNIAMKPRTATEGDRLVTMEEAQQIEKLTNGKIPASSSYNKPVSHVKLQYEGLRSNKPNFESTEEKLATEQKFKAENLQIEDINKWQKDTAEDSFSAEEKLGAVSVLDDLNDKGATGKFKNIFAEMASAISPAAGEYLKTEDASTWGTIQKLLVPGMTNVVGGRVAVQEFMYLINMFPNLNRGYWGNKASIEVLKSMYKIRTYQGELARKYADPKTNVISPENYKKIEAEMATHIKESTQELRDTLEHLDYLRGSGKFVMKDPKTKEYETVEYSEVPIYKKKGYTLLE